MESIGELIEKLVIANIKLWMVKDAQTSFLSKSNSQSLLHHLKLLERTESLEKNKGNFLDDYQVLLKNLAKITPSSKEKELIILKDLIRKDIELCEARASLRRSINQRLGDKTPTDTVKQYGKRKKS